MNSIKDEIIEEVVEGIEKFAIPAPLINDSHLAEIKKILLPGDLIFCRRDYEFSNSLEELIASKSSKEIWGHVAIYLGPVYEAVTREGFRKCSLEMLSFPKDAIGVGRFPGDPLTDEEVGKSITFFDARIGWPYNHSLDLSVFGKMFCTQAALEMRKNIRPNDVAAIKLTKIAGIESLSPQDFWNSVVQITKVGDV